MIIDIENNKQLTQDDCRFDLGDIYKMIDGVKNYLQVAVYCWCKNVKGEKEWFAARDFLGGENFYWEGTPMMALYEYYKKINPDNYAKAQDEAGKAAGWLLKQVLLEDRRTFETRKGYRTREYRWTGKENL